MRKITCTLLLLLTFSTYVFSQKEKRDTIPSAIKDSTADDDTSLDYDGLFDDLDAFLDSLLSPRSYFLLSASGSSGYFNFKEKNNNRIYVLKKIIYSPSVGYFHKSGLGIAVTGNMINTDNKLNLYQYAVSPSVDFLKNRNLIGGFSYTHYFTKDSLPFYTTPIKDEVNAYITWRKPWLQPSLSVNYGWGSSADYKARLNFIQNLRLRKRIINLLGLNDDNSVSDFSVVASVAHNFYWLNVLAGKDNIRLTPQLLFTSGTQQYGLNQSAVNTSATKTTRANALTNAKELMLDAKQQFKPISLTASIKAEYSIGKFFIQPQFVLDYYFPAEKDNLSAIFSLSAGLNF